MVTHTKDLQPCKGECVFQTLNVVSYDFPAVYSFSVCMCVHCSFITANQGGDRINKMLTCIYGFEIHRLC